MKRFCCNKEYKTQRGNYFITYNSKNTFVHCGRIKENPKSISSQQWESYAVISEEVNIFSIGLLTDAEEIALGNRNHVVGMTGIVKSLSAQFLEIGRWNAVF